MNSITRPVVEVDGLTKRFGSLVAVREARFRLAEGEVYALLGRNGSGKSTTLRCLLGQLKADDGMCRVFGLDSWADRQRVMERVGVVPESADVPLDLTADAAAGFVRGFYPKWNHANYLEKLERFDVPLDRRFVNLSKGQQKQVNLALALAMTPDLLILDDPTLGLDAVARKVLFEELIGELADRGTTVLITTHDLAGIDGLADRVGIVRRGEVLVDEGLEELKARFRRIRMKVDQLDSLPIDDLDYVARRRVADFEEIVAVDFDRQDHGRWAGVPGTVLETMDLEEIFLALNGEEFSS